MKDGFLDEHLKKCQALYRASAEAMQDALRQYLGDCARWTPPAGGMFLWLELPAHVDASKLLDAALAAAVAYVPGAPFFASSPQANTMRLCFSTAAPETIARGIEILGGVIRASATPGE